jgi:Domain of unknown function (DUF5916)
MWRSAFLSRLACRRLFPEFLASLALYTATLTGAAAQIVVDGQIDEPEWQAAQRCEDWSRTLPFARDAARYGNDVRILATEAGLAAAFIIEQPPAERRIKPRTPRDADPLTGDTVALMVDFDANGHVGYEFTVGLGGGVRDGLITNQNKFDRDWDGTWQHAVRETEDQWIVELLVPWSSISMRQSLEPTRIIGVYANRFLSERRERYACPGISSDSAVFLSDFRRIEIPQFESATTFDLVPYATAISDLLHERTRFKGGADLSWKISPNLRLAATLNPDFGQVESDELVVDFSAIETVLTDKRPFFTESQGIFDLRTPANGQLIYTRRIGAAPDDGSAGSSDIDAALKLTGTARSLIYGAFVAQEADYDSDLGRRFGAARLALPFEQARLGYLTTWTEHPLIERKAWINALDYELAPNERWRLSGQLIRSDIETLGDDSLGLVAPGGPTRAASVDEDGYQVWLQTDFNRAAPLSHTMRLLHIDDDFDLNDLGYMERNALEQIEWDTTRRSAGAGDGRINGETQRLYAFYRQNSEGARLPSRLQLSREVQYASSWRAYGELRHLTSGVDDLLSRGNGPVQIDSRYAAYFETSTPRLGDWQLTFGSYLFQQGVEDYSARLELLALWYPTEKLTLRVDLMPEYSQDWLLWERGTLFGAYRSARMDFDLRLDWLPAPRHELRLKWQWIGVDAEPRAAYRTDAAGQLRPAADRLVPFTVNNLGLQIRYRYEIGPLSELFLVYGRGGFEMLQDEDRGLPRLFRDSPSVRDADQFLVKVRYRL